MTTIRSALLLAAALVAVAPVALAASPMAPPAPASLAFGSPPARVASVLGKAGPADDQGDFTWRDYDLAGGHARLAYYHDRLSIFTLTPDAPMSWSCAQGWARAFLPGFDRGRQVRTDPARWLAFQTFVLMGRPFEAELHFDRDGDRVTGMGGEIHWMD